ncbi:cytochrome P450 [Infundibulicybe gibba]|nr:cytochrome P450 [Infundibulicybe gibba]
MAVNEDLQLPYTMNEAQLQNPYQAAVIRTNVNRAIPTFIPEILDESDLAMGETFKSTKNDVLVFDTMTHLIARISNRVIFGTEMCRNEGFLREIVRFAETTPLIAPFITWSPVTLRPFVYFVMSTLLGGKKGSLKFILPFLKRYTDERASMEEKPPIVAEFLIKSAPPQETLEGIAIRLMNINLGASIRRHSIFITQALFELALLPREQLDDIRLEIEVALESEGGWNKAALLKFKKVDSVLREAGRVYGLMHFALPRFALQGCGLDNGLSVPPGYRIAIDMKAVHFNAEAYPDPEKFDAFRFSKLRALEESDTKYGFATVDNNYLPFGAGRHACAGRFFAAMELKIMLAHILLKYDIAFLPGMVGRPQNIVFNGAIVPDPKAHLIFSKRESVRADKF